MGEPVGHMDAQGEPLERETLLAVLQARERYLSGILGSLESFVTVDADWRVTFANAATLRTTGRSGDELVGSDLREIARAAFPHLDLTQIERTMHERVMSEFEAATAGRARVFHCSAYPLADGSVAVYAREVTERERERDALHSSEELYRELVESVNSAVVRWTREGRITFLNDYAERLFGWRSEEVVGAPVTILLPDRDGEEPSYLIDGILSDPEGHATSINRNGRRLWMAWTNRALRDEEGRVGEVLAIGNDITELVEAQSALRESEERLQIATEATDLGVHDYDVRAGVIEWDARLRGMWGLTLDEPVTFETFIGGIHPEDRARIQKAMDAALDPTGLHRFRETYRVVSRDGTHRWVTATGHVLFEGDEAVRLVGTAEDVTSRIETQEALRKSEERYRAIVELADEDLTVSADGAYSFRERIEGAARHRPRLRTRLAGFAAGARHHRALILLGAVAVELAFLVPMGAAPATRHILGLPGSLLTLTVVVAAVLAGWQVGLAAALVGGAVFWGTVAGLGAQSAAVTTIASIGIWGAAALLAGFLTDSLTEQVRLRRRAAVALARAEILREQEAERAAQQERTKIARDLHDSVTQALFAATLKAEALTIAGDQTPAAVAALEDVRRLSRGSLAQMRTMLLELRGDPVEEVPLQQLLRHLVEATESRASVKVGLAIEEDRALAPRVHEAVYRIAQEALNNVVRHARAENAWVRLRAEDGRALLVVGDDGQGFDEATVAPGHFGLASMRERAAETGGELVITSESGDGTVVTAEWRQPLV